MKYLLLIHKKWKNVAGYEENENSKQISCENLKWRDFMRSRHKWMDHIRVDLKRHRR